MKSVRKGASDGIMPEARDFERLKRKLEKRKRR